eukprot:CAMPEP_0202338190 /NCGR_PEP_ID=MMETSP1126-20121109/562_1 /ASSEMBLY_ACC=CAM_ASM_000457 /TAXON_ID=3047 /ORGANISM="Dunaliella tertiolecta, Strain CCMP1320" /LENGTH=367 /DNA_ID=CAMNT_0048928513 /DNA_START=78 /DNA_END=1182 /DNA_ORIENTATION=-
MPLPAPDVHALVQELQEKHGCPADQARALACMFHSVPECLPFIEKPSDRRNAFSPTWKEYFSKKYQRYYYHGEHGQNGWDYPQQLQLQDWMLDSEMYGLNIVAAATICRRMQELLYDSWAAPGPLWKGVALLARLMCNVVACSNGIDKYRCIKASNQKVKEDILSLPGASCVIVEAGFVQTGDGSGDFLFPSPGAAGEQEALKRASLVAAKLQQLVDKRGFTGMATEVDDTDAGLSGHGNTKRNKWTGKPGFMYQQDVYECSVCASPINDGSERFLHGSGMHHMGSLGTIANNVRGILTCAKHAGMSSKPPLAQSPTQGPWRSTMIPHTRFKRYILGQYGTIFTGRSQPPTLGEYLQIQFHHEQGSD